MPLSRSWVNSRSRFSARRTKPKASPARPSCSCRCSQVMMSKGTFDSMAHEKRAAEALLKKRLGEVDSGEDEDSEESVIEENVLTPSELVRAIEAALDPYRVPIAMAAYCGLRQAEILGLKWSDIDWEARPRSGERSEAGSSRARARWLEFAGKAIKRNVIYVSDYCGMRLSTGRLVGHHRIE